MAQISPALQAKIHKQEFKQNINSTQPNLSIDTPCLKQLNEDKFDYSIDDGKISTKDKMKNFAKGLITPITAMFSSPKSFLIGAGMIAVGAGFTIATGGAIAPLMVALGVTGGALQLGTSVYKASKATTDEEAIKAWQGIGAGTSAVVGSVAGSKAALKGAGVNTKGMNSLTATIECFKQIPNSISKSASAFVSGQAITNFKNIFKPKKTTKTNVDSENAAKTKQKNKAEKQIENKIEQKAQQQTEKAKQTNPNKKTDTAETLIDNQTEASKKQTPEVSEAKAKTTLENNADNSAEIQTKTTQETKPKAPDKQKPEVIEAKTAQETKSKTPVEQKNKVPKTKTTQTQEVKKTVVKPQEEVKPLVQEIMQKDGTKVTLTRNENGQIIRSEITKLDGTCILKEYENGKCVSSSSIKCVKGCPYGTTNEYRYNADGKVVSIQSPDSKRIFNYNKNGEYIGCAELDYENNLINKYNQKNQLIDSVTDFSMDIEQAINELNARQQFDNGMLIEGKSVVRKTTVIDKQTGKSVEAYITMSNKARAAYRKFDIYAKNDSGFERIGTVTTNPFDEGYYSIENLYGSQSQKVNKYKGAGTELLKQCSIDSYNHGQKGEFALRSGGMSSDAFYRHIGLQGYKEVFKLPECAVLDFLLR